MKCYYFRLQFPEYQIKLLIFDEGDLRIFLPFYLKVKTITSGKIKGYEILIQSVEVEEGRYSHSSQKLYRIPSSAFLGNFLLFQWSFIFLLGRSKPSASITTPTLGSPPQEINLDKMISVNSTYLTLHLHRWPDGGCPIKYYVIEYKEESQPTWRIVSNNIRSEEENIIISDLLPATWYSVQLTAHNGAGSRVITSQVC